MRESTQRKRPKPNTPPRCMRGFATFVWSAAVVVASVSLNAAGTYKAPRGLDGKHPDLNGIWQALNEANYDVERHNARASLALRDGPVGPVPALSLIHI